MEIIYSLWNKGSSNVMYMLNAEYIHDTDPQK